MQITVPDDQGNQDPNTSSNSASLPDERRNVEIFDVVESPAPELDEIDLALLDHIDSFHTESVFENVEAAECEQNKWESNASPKQISISEAGLEQNLTEWGQIQSEFNDSPKQIGKFF